ncbi:palmitoyltransferase ZDHHC19 [Heteronotia binoei]|uniref:palmitoyltransferase ZDHHC19 n=1 Tax=Heteronotia binoei TaxID=13085 RepID=UPI00292F775E|nr:palmitoyltransferase ZDHHC19 [Heteronotia binoei]
MGRGGRVGRPYLLSSIFASFHFSLLLCLTCLFFTFPCSWLTLHISWGYPVICGLLFIPTIIFFLRTSFTDTSILRKGIEEELENQAIVIRAPRQHWCNRCQLHGLPHTFHCTWCNTCVEDFDHHCMWLNNCIGRHNIRSFFLFVVFLSGYNAAVMASCLAYLVLNSQKPFSVEKICTIVVTIPTAFYLLPLLIQLSTQLSNIRKDRHKCKLHQAHHATQGKTFRSPQAWWWTVASRIQQGPNCRANSAARPKAQAPNARKAPTVLGASPVSSSRSTAPSSSPGGGPRDKPGEWRAAEAWRHFLAAAGRVLRLKGPAPGESTQQAAQEASKKKSSWLLNASDIPIPEMPESLQLLDEDHDTHWKCQLYINRRAPASPTGTLLSLSDI